MRGPSIGLLCAAECAGCGSRSARPPPRLRWRGAQAAQQWPPDASGSAVSSNCCTRSYSAGRANRTAKFPGKSSISWGKCRLKTTLPLRSWSTPRQTLREVKVKVHLVSPNVNTTPGQSNRRGPASFSATTRVAHPFLEFMMKLRTWAGVCALAIASSSQAATLDVARGSFCDMDRQSGTTAPGQES